MLKTIKTLLKAAAHRFIYGRPIQATPEVALMPEMIVVADGFEGHSMLKATRHRDHISVYWPGRGENYLAGPTFGRVTISADARHRLDVNERAMLEQRMQAWGAQALWLEV